MRQAVEDIIWKGTSKSLWVISNFCAPVPTQSAGGEARKNSRKKGACCGKARAINRGGVAGEAQKGDLRGHIQLPRGSVRQGKQIYAPLPQIPSAVPNSAMVRFTARLPRAGRTSRPDAGNGRRGGRTGRHVAAEAQVHREGRQPGHLQVTCWHATDGVQL